MMSPLVVTILNLMKNMGQMSFSLNGKNYFNEQIYLTGQKISMPYPHLPPPLDKCNIQKNQKAGFSSVLSVFHKAAIYMQVPDLPYTTYMNL